MNEVIRDLYIIQYGNNNPIRLERFLRLGKIFCIDSPTDRFVDKYKAFEVKDG